MTTVRMIRVGSKPIRKRLPDQTLLAQLPLSRAIGMRRYLTSRPQQAAPGQSRSQVAAKFRLSVEQVTALVVVQQQHCTSLGALIAYKCVVKELFDRLVVAGQ